MYKDRALEDCEALTEMIGPEKTELFFQTFQSQHIYLSRGNKYWEQCEAIVGKDATEQIAFYLGQCRYFVTRYVSNWLRNQKILDDFNNGVSRGQIMNKYHIAQSTFYDIVRELR